MEQKSHNFFRVAIIKDVQCDLHIHYHDEFVCVKEGELEVGTPAKTYLLSAGTALFVPSYMPHRFHTEHHSETAIIEFSRDYVQERFRAEAAVFSLSAAAVEQLAVLNGMTCKEARLAMAYTLHAHLREAVGTVGSEADDSITKKVYDYISEHYREPITLKTAAAYGNMNYSYLSRLFKEKIGISFSEALADERIYHANLLLRTTERSVSEIAFDCGFNNLRSFNKAFHKTMGCSPTDLRKAMLL